MPDRLVNRVGIDDVLEHGSMVVGLAGGPDGETWALLFQAPFEAQDEDDDFNSYCISTEQGNTEYGGLRHASLTPHGLTLVFDPQTSNDLGLEDSTIDLILQLKDQDIRNLREALSKILSYGKQSEIPVLEGF